MSLLSGVGLVAGGTGLLGLAACYLGHPASLLLAAGTRPPSSPAPAPSTGNRPPARPRSVAVLVACRGQGDLLAGKVADTLAQQAPPSDPGETQTPAADPDLPPLSVIVAADGPWDDEAAAWIATTGKTLAPRVICVPGGPVIEGKVAALNRAVVAAQTLDPPPDLLILTDMDARLAPGALAALIAPFDDPATGLVCGQRVIGPAATGKDHTQRPPEGEPPEGGLTEAQSAYIRWDSHLKSLESRLGFLTSNDGKLYALRRAGFPGFAPAVADDLDALLTVQEAGGRAVFAPRARALIPRPARSLAAEAPRRRRVVVQGLAAILRHRRLLDPRRHGLLATGLLFNKVFRRLTPLFALLVLLGGPALTDLWPPLALLPLGLLALIAAALIGGPLLTRWGAMPSALRRGLSLARYVCVGNLGMAWGVVSLLRGERITAWTPDKGPQ